MGKRTESREDILWGKCSAGDAKEENKDTEDEEEKGPESRHGPGECLGGEAKREEFQRVKGWRYQVL